MNKISLYALRFGLATTFIWIGILILQNPVGWSRMIQPWAVELLPTSPEAFMTSVGYLDIAIGALLLTPFAWLGALLGTIHIFSVVISIGGYGIIARDIGLFAASLALVVELRPARLRKNSKI